MPISEEEICRIQLFCVEDMSLDPSELTAASVSNVLFPRGLGRREPFFKIEVQKIFKEIYPLVK